jgi:hypothetical protein
VRPEHKTDQTRIDIRRLGPIIDHKSHLDSRSLQSRRDSQDCQIPLLCLASAAAAASALKARSSVSATSEASKVICDLEMRRLDANCALISLLLERPQIVPNSERLRARRCLLPNGNHGHASVNCGHAAVDRNSPRAKPADNRLL